LGATGAPPAADQQSSTAGQKLGVIATIVAIALLVVYIVFLVLQWNNVDAGDLPWSRRSDLLGGLEALAFAAAGAVLGTTVQRQVTKKAEGQAEDAKKQAAEEKARADTNQKAAEKARALHNLAEVKAEQAGGGLVARGTGETRAAGGGDLNELLALARRYDQS
jgi:hypothetical protein